MSILKLSVSKSKRYNPVTKKMGCSGRVITNGTATFEDLCNLAGKGMTLDPIEIEACAKAFCRDAAAQLRDGKIVDLGPLGKLYPSCSSPWVEDPDDLTLDSVKPALYYKPADEVEAAIKGAKLVWAKTKAEDDENAAPQGGTTSTDAETPDPGTNTGGDQGGGTGTIDTGGTASPDPSQGGENDGGD